MAYTKIINDAFDAGISEAWSFWRMTPAEVSGRLKAHAARQQTAMERMDMLAWMTGVYAAKGYHDPKKYPKRPNLIEKPRATDAMDEDTMKTVLTAYAEIHNTIEGEQGR